MFFFFYDSQNIKIEIGLSPKDSELAIVSIDQYGNLGQLNNFVLKEYGYSEQILKGLDLKKGFDLFQLNHKPILFIVTISDLLINNQNKTKENLSSNLSKAIDTYFDFFKSKSIWIPLMGTGSGGLKLEESLNIITDVLKTKILIIEKNNCSFNISIPKSSEGQKLLKKITETNNLDQKAKISKLNAQKIINDLDARFYLVGSNWGHAGDQSEKFYKKGVWENGYEDGIYSEIVNSVKENDVLINKSTFATKEKENFLQLKAIGKVTKNLNNGRELEVNWFYKLEEFKNIKGLSFYRDTITTPNREDLLTIFSSIDSKHFEELYFNIVDNNNKIDSNISVQENEISKVVAIKNTTTLAGLISDIETGTDYLDITKDVNAFARVMAAKSFEPPLAIALLGKWGSGKSFFMNKLKEGIQTLSQRNPEKQFCEGIAHVHFNAWSYMDANLWASIVTRTFEGLDEYINSLSLTDKEKREIEQQLFQKLTISKEENNELISQKKQVKNRLHELKTTKKNIKREVQKKISSIRNNSLKELLNKVNEEFKVQDQLEQTLNANPTFVDSSKEFEKIVPKQYWENPSAFYNELKSIHTFIKTFFHRNRWKTNVYWILVFLLLILITPIFTFLTNLLLSWQDFRLSDKTWFSITVIGTIFTRGIDTYLKLKKQIAPFWNLKEKYEEKNEEIIFKFKQEEKAINLEITQKKVDILQINKEISANLELKANLEYKLQSALSTQALYSFIEKRANSEDYKKHLGIVSLIRKDFEILSGLLTGHKTELVTDEDSTKFKEMFPNKRPLERIILYVDDLDRCPEERVVEVLEAVNLLMAFPLFVVVVGVDPRWVKTALKKKYKNQFAENKDNEDAISPSNYLEKIFQVPFHLKDSGDDSIKNMIKTLAQIKPNIISTITDGDFDPDDFDADDFDTGNVEEQPTHIEIEELIQSGSTNSLLNKETIEALDITEKECELMQNMSEIIGNNPRAIKRFVNIYRIIKTHEDFGFNNEDSKDAELAVIMFLLAIPMGKFKVLNNSIENSIISTVSNVRPEFNYFTGAEKFEITSKEYVLKKELDKIISSSKNSEVRTQNIDFFKRHYQFIKRFTFKNI